MRRTLETYALCSPRAVAEGSPAQMFHFVGDAKADIAEMAKVIEEVRGVVRILEAMKLAGCLGKSQIERLTAAKARLDAFIATA